MQIIDEKLQSQTDSGNKYVPDLITLSISRKMGCLAGNHPTLNQVASEVEAGWLEQGYQFRVPLRIQLAQNPRLTVDAIEISTSLTHPSVETSKPRCRPRFLETPVEAVTPENAYFIINGKEQLYLTKAIIKIGRRSTSDIQIDDPLVSRDHLLLRAKQGYYLLLTSVPLAALLSTISRSRPPP